MRKLTEEEFKKLRAAEGRAERFAAMVDRKTAQLDELFVDMTVAESELADLRHRVHVHKQVLNTVWGLWSANHRVTMGLQKLLPRRGLLGEWLANWLTTDSESMTSILDWAAEETGE